MVKTPVVLYKTLIIGIILLFIGTSIVSSTDNTLKEIPVDSFPLEPVISSDEKFISNTTVYMFIVFGYSGTGFYAFYDDGTYLFSEWTGDDFFSGGTWTNDGRYLCCLYKNGTLYDIDPETLDACAIGDGGVSLNGLAYNPVNEKLYGASGKDLYEIDKTTGEQTYIGAFGIDNVSHMIAIAFDINGICYGWDVKFSGESYLYKVNTSTGEATIVGGMGMTLIYAQDGAFEYDTDILYLVAYTSSMGNCLLECDEDTGECYYISHLPGVTTTALAIPYEIDNEPPVTTIHFDPSEPDGENGWYKSIPDIYFEATDDMSGVNHTFYRIEGGCWEEYLGGPIVFLGEDGEYIIEFYSVDNAGNVEDVKSADFKIDKTNPESTLEWKVWKEGLKWYVKFILNASDATSGMGERLEFFINDVLQDSFNVNWPTFELVIPWDKNYKFVTFGFKFSDLAGNHVYLMVNGSDINSRSRINLSNRYSSNIWFQWFFDRFPFLEVIVSRIMNL
jgi:hypothetical protein